MERSGVPHRPRTLLLKKLKGRLLSYYLLGINIRRKMAHTPSKKQQMSRPLPAARQDGSPPSAEDYRLKAADIDYTLCLGRQRQGDQRWSPAVQMEHQCEKKPLEGSHLCKTCTRRLEAYIADPSTTKEIRWGGLVTEEPFDWVHMLGTAWAKQKPPRWLGGGAAAASVTAGDSDGGAESVASLPEEDIAAAPAVVVAELPPVAMPRETIIGALEHMKQELEAVWRPELQRALKAELSRYIAEPAVAALLAAEPARGMIVRALLAM